MLIGRDLQSKSDGARIEPTDVEVTEITQQTRTQTDIEAREIWRRGRPVECRRETTERRHIVIGRFETIVGGSAHERQRGASLWRGAAQVVNPKL